MIRSKYIPKKTNRQTDGLTDKGGNERKLYDKCDTSDKIEPEVSQNID